MNRSSDHEICESLNNEHNIAVWFCNQLLNWYHKLEHSNVVTAAQYRDMKLKNGLRHSYCPKEVSHSYQNIRSYRQLSLNARTRVFEFDGSIDMTNQPILFKRLNKRKQTSNEIANVFICKNTPFYLRHASRFLFRDDWSWPDSRSIQSRISEFPFSIRPQSPGI
jgi:hypothetical protein